jgi:hypothetical protein
MIATNADVNHAFHGCHVLHVLAVNNADVQDHHAVDAKDLHVENKLKNIVQKIVES